MAASSDNPGDVPAPNFTLLSAANARTPFPFRQPILLRPSTLASPAAKLLRGVQDLVSRNPLLRNLASLKMDFDRMCRQINCRKLGGPRLPSNHNFAAMLPGDSMAGLVVANGLTNFLNIYNTLLVVRLVLTWFPNAPPAIVSPLSTLCDPYLNIFRGIIPPLGGSLDFSPILAFIVLNAFTSTAAALPAEFPPAASVKDVGAPYLGNLTASNKKWMKRLQGSRSKSSENVA
ncbi:hypothetical protein MLD38_006501 [Melastoma candidum]|uniref:Uncharacterized protein n=1 Tax=Melastoma candidum TaxID=119954 RepID=A0ACB9RMN3_9MYRT|nr:hypothetical protein MLD38_006501 [Melastoma candidum]